MANNKIASESKQYIYIIQASLEPSKCKIGKTINLERRLNEYNNMTGKSKENIYRYLFTCEVTDMTEVENAITSKFRDLREEKSKEIYFYNSALFDSYVKFIREQKLFVQEIFIRIEASKQITKVKIVKRTTPSLEDRGVSRKELMQKAQKVCNDEFYTRYEDIEKELSMYDKSIWKDRVVFCNCDDAVDDNEKNSSAFALYFLRNFNELELNKLICTHYGGVVDLFNQGREGYVFTRVFTRDGFTEIKEYPKNYDGSFDHPLSLKILTEEADIVCTNPPFSIAIAYWDITIKSGKKFIIISNITNPITPAFIPYFKNNQVWAGYNRVDWYLNPKKQLTEAAGHWYTNIPIGNRPKYKQLKMAPLKDIPEKYKKYDDSETLIVDSGYIPCDYTKPFAISARPILNGILEKGYKIIEEKQYFPYVKGKKCFGRVLIQKEL
jgi:hypothetical protein